MDRFSARTIFVAKSVEFASTTTLGMGSNLTDGSKIASEVSAAIYCAQLDLR